MKTIVSVIIPVYNGEKYLHRCLDSIKNQSYKDLQIICIDDGSKDSTYSILKDYAKHDKRFVLIHKQNAGVSAARNDGIKQATGKYIHFMDADDIIDVDFYKYLVASAQTTKADIVCAGFVSNNKHSRSLQYKRTHVSRGMFGKLFWSQLLVRSFVWRLLFNADFLHKTQIQFNTKLISQEDAVFLLELVSLANMLVVIPNVNYHYLFNEESTLNNHESKHYAKIKKQYKLGKSFRRQYAYDNNIFVLWFFRKLINVFF